MYYAILFVPRDCENGESAYKAFQLESVYSTDKISSLAEPFKKKARQLADQVHLPEDSTLNIVFLSPETRERMSEFAHSRINRVKFDTFADEVRIYT